MKQITLFLIIFIAFSWNEGLTQVPPTNIMQNRGQNHNFLGTLKDGSSAAYVQFGRPKVNHALAMINPPGSGYTTQEFQGFLGVMPASDSQTGALYFQVAEDELLSATGTFYVQVSYFDQGQGAMELRYKSIAPGPNQPIQEQYERFYLGNSGRWMNHSFTLRNAVLDQLFESETDFMIKCTGIPIRMVSLSRSPLSSTERPVSPIFDQPKVIPPKGLFLGVVPDQRDADLWVSEAALEGKAKLYSSWGASNIIHTIQGNQLVYENGRVSFAKYAPRVQGLVNQRMNWVPRFEIGSLSSLPSGLRADLQNAYGVQQNNPGPQISLWEPKLADRYSQVFRALNSDFPSRVIPQIVLAFSSGFGPLLHDGKGWPDIWAGDPLATHDFQTMMRQRYGNLKRIGQVWQQNLTAWNQVVPLPAEELSPQANIDIQNWYRARFAQTLEQIIQSTKQHLPRTQIVIEIGDSFYYSLCDPQLLGEVAARHNASILYQSNHPVPSRSYEWNLLSQSCRQLGVPFGLKISGYSSVENLLGALYSLASEGASSLVFDEGLLAAENTWNQYLSVINNLSISNPSRKVAVVLPRSSIYAAGQDLEYDRLIQQMRELFAFDVIDETQLGRISSSQYPIIISIWGHLWESSAIERLNQVARSGSALVVSTDSPWQTLTGNVDFNEKMFMAKVERQAGQYVLVPRTSKTSPHGDSSLFTPKNRRVLSLGEADSIPYLTGDWSLPQERYAAEQYGFQFDRFRWMGEQGNILLPMQSNKNYQLYIDGFLPEGKQAQVIVNGRTAGSIQGQGQFQWSKPLQGSLQPRQPNVEVTLRAQTWSMGEVMGATQVFQPSMAVNRVAILPANEDVSHTIALSESDKPQPDFKRQALRGSWLKEHGIGMTLIAPTSYVGQWVFMELVNSIVQQPKLIDPRFKFNQPIDFEHNGVLVSPQNRGSIYVNLNRQPVQLVDTESRRRINLPALDIVYR